MLQNSQSNEALQAELHVCQIANTQNAVPASILTGIYPNLNRDNFLMLNIWTKFPDINLESGLS